MAPPVPTASAPPTSRLPISRAALTALDKCRRPHPFQTTAELSTVVITAALSDGSTPTTAPAKYVIRRLLTGVSVSSGATRLNYSLILTALTRQLVAAGDKNTPDECVKAVKTVYGPEGSFDTRYNGALRERALGTLASIAAVLTGCQGVKYSASTVREIVMMLRSTVDADAGKWRLGCAVIRVMERLLPLVSTRDKDAVLKPMWAWCESRLENEDGLQLALLLQKRGFIPNKAFINLYPSLEGSVLVALMDTFEGGFTSIAEDLFQSEDNQKKACKYIIPLGWRLSVEYVLTEKGAHHWGGIAKFWRQAVFQGLLESSRSPEKKLLALELINIVLDHIHDDESFRTIFDKSLSGTIRLFLSHHANQRRRNGSVQVRATRARDYVTGQLNQSARRVGESILTHLCGESKTKEERSRLICDALLWALRGGILFKLFPSDLLARSLKIMSRKDTCFLLANTVSRYAKPLGGAGSNQVEKARAMRQRPIAVRLLFTIAREHPYLMKDVIRVIVLYSLFQQVESESVKQAKIPVAFDYLDFKECDVENELYLRLLPRAEPDLKPEILNAGFRQLVSFLTELRNGEPFQALATFCVSLIRKISAADRSVCVPRVSTPFTPLSLVSKGSKDLQGVALEVIDQLTAAQSSGVGSPTFSALKTITQFLYIFMFEPRDVPAESSERTRVLTSNYVILMQKVSSTCQLLCQGGENQRTIGTPNDGETIPELIEPAEHIAHLIAELCGRDSSSFRHVALIAVQALGQSIDDKVIAVLFDSMDSYLREGENIQEEENEDDEVEIGEAIGDGFDSDEDNMSASVEDETSDDDEEGEEEDHHSDANLPERGVNGQEGSTSADKAGSAEEKRSGSDSDDDVGMDIDEEDPSVLEKFDKVLGAHLSLLREEKKITKARKERAAFQFVKISRVLSLIEAVSRMLRVALEKWDDEDQRLALVFMDLHVRLYEFVLGGESKSSRFLKEVSNIVSKQLLLPCSAFTGKISDEQTALEISDRFFELMRTRKEDRKGDVTFLRTVSRSARMFMSIVESLSGNASSRYFPLYSEMLENMLREDFHFWTPDVFHSFIQLAPEISLKFMQPLATALKADRITKSKRSLVSNFILMISTQVYYSTQVCPDAADTFWELVTNFVESECVGTDLTRKWTSSAFGDMVRVVGNGLAGGHITSGNNIVFTLGNELDKFSLTKQERNRLSKMLKRPKPVAVSNSGDEKEMKGTKRHGKRRTGFHKTGKKQKT